MKPELLIFIAFSCTLNAIGQTNSGFTNKAEAKNIIINGLKEGKWIEYISDDGIISYDSSSIENGIGIVDSNGNIVGIPSEYYLIVYKSDKRNGIERDYDISGILRSEIPYDNDTINGVVRTFYKSGKLKNEGVWSNDKMNGIQKEYYEDGKLKTEISFAKGVKGTTRNFDKNGAEIRQ